MLSPGCSVSNVLKIVGCFSLGSSDGTSTTFSLPLADAGAAAVSTASGCAC